MTYLAQTLHAGGLNVRARRLAVLCGLAAKVLAGAALAVAVGCSPSGTSMEDMAPAINYTAATINQIDSDPGNGPFGNGQNVVLDRVVAVTKVDKYVNSTNQQCRYQIWVQDATCTTPPCGLVVKAIGPKAPSPTASGKDCPSASISGTPLSTISRGDNVRIRGHVIVEIDSTPPMSVVEHQVFVDSLEILTPDQTVTPIVLTDPTMYGQFVTHLGQTWKKYEGMSVTLQPSVGVLQVTAFGSGGFQTSPGNSNWGDTFDGDYYPTGVTMYPIVGSTFHALSGVVSTRHGGELMPGRSKDFVP